MPRKPAKPVPPPVSQQLSVALRYAVAHVLMLLQSTSFWLACIVTVPVIVAELSPETLAAHPNLANAVKITLAGCAILSKLVVNNSDAAAKAKGPAT